MSFASIIGHQQVRRLLQQAVARQSVPQSMLLAGPEGVGKHAIAIALAQAVNCPSSIDGDGCGMCQTCGRIARGQHFDVVTLGLEGAASIGIPAVRERVLDAAGYRPFEARRRVFIIDPADALTPQAQDALLKTLEEPPPASLFILITACPDALVPTVQSRCRRLRCGALAERDVARVLTERCGIEADRARDLAALAGGTVAGALALADAAGQLSEDRDVARALLAAWAGDRLDSRLKAAAQLAEHEKKRRSREALSTRLGLLAALLRDLSAILCGDPNAVVHTDVLDDLRRYASAFDRGRVLAAWSALDSAQNALERNGSPKIIADWVALAI
jgi:DNA polymerase-3 subunit delta'